MTILPLLLSLAAADVHSFGNHELVQTTHLSLDLTLRFQEKTIRGVCDLTLAYPRGGKAASTLDLDTRGLKVEKVLDPGTGKDVPFTLEAAVPILGRRLRIVLPQPRPRKVRVVYEAGAEASALQWLDPPQTTSGRWPFLFTQSQAINARSWIPCMDSPGVRVTYDAVVRVPPGMTAVMSAEHLAHEPDKGIFRFRMPQAIPPYLIALAAGEIGFRALSPRTGVYAEPAVLEKAAWEFADMEKMVEATEGLYGPYAWGRWDTIVLPPSFPFGGMENPRITFATPTVIAGDRSLTGLLAHELAHSWSGNLVTNATWSDFWLNEGFTTYIEGRIVEAVYGGEIAEMQALLGQRELRSEVDELLKKRPDDTKLALDLAGRDPDDAMSAIAYQKGANLLRVLEKHFGRRRFDPFLRRYFAKNAFRSMSTARFLEILRKDLFGKDQPSWRALRVEEWVYGAGIPDNIDVPSSDRFERSKAAAEAFARTGSFEAVGADTWITTEWLGFLNNLPREMTTAQMEALDSRFAFSRTGNSEILFSWLMHCVRNTYEPAFPALEGFLTRQGRRKFLRPLYQAMQGNPRTRELAKTIYAKARPTYHPIATATIDAIMK